MAGSTFQANQYELVKILDECHDGLIQLPQFQRSWVWDEDRIIGLLASISRGFPVGALMSLETGGPVHFRSRTVEGAPDFSEDKARSLLLDGQQRITSLYQVMKRGKAVEILTHKRKMVRRWFYIDIRRALDPALDPDAAIVAVPEDRIEQTDFGREIKHDVSTPEKEYGALMFPVSQVFDWDNWQDGFYDFWSGDQGKSAREHFRTFKKNILENFKSYRMPIICLDRSTSKEAVCVVFEKVNTAGKSLDAFELVTAMYAASGHELRKDWYGDSASKGRQRRLSDVLRLATSDRGILSGVSSTDFLQAVSLFHTRDLRREAEKAGKQGKELPPVSGSRAALLNLPLDAYRRFEDQVERGFVEAAKFLDMLNIYRVIDLPYQSQIVPLAAILADLGASCEHEGTHAKLVRWYWCGVFGELYGSAVESRIARDFMEVPAWLKGGPEPSTVSETIFRADRLKTMRMRLSAAYKGVNALLMQQGAQDFRSGKEFDRMVFFGENVDIHHIFPQAWCKARGLLPDVFDSIINKTPLSYRTNIFLGGDAPSHYTARLEKGNKDWPPIAGDTLDAFVKSHAIDPALLRADAFEAFLDDRQRRLLAVIEQAMGKPSYVGSLGDDSEGAEMDEQTEQAALTLAAE